MTDGLTKYTNATKDVALFDLGQRAQIELRGNDRQSFLHNFCTNDINKLTPGEGCEAFLTNIKGRILGHIIASAINDVLWIDSEPDTAQFIVSHLDKYLITEEVEITDRTHDLAELLLVGPNAGQWLSDHLNDFAIPSLNGLTNAAFDGIDVMVRQVPFTAQPSFQLIVPKTVTERLQQSIQQSDVSLATPDVFEALRIEAGYPRYGVDLTDENIAQEANRTNQAISFTKGCYLGQEPIARLDALGHVNKDLRRLELADGPAPSPGTPVLTTAGDEVGRITSAAISPPIGHPIALAMLKTSASATDATLSVNGTEATIAR
ncbi:MAG: folate-binding protein YgfZ [Planctomycetaceae bacterium]|nr:folate-binding protein YgfZ [Planctomycetaceae bacterium]